MCIGLAVCFGLLPLQFVMRCNHKQFRRVTYKSYDLSNDHWILRLPTGLKVYACLHHDITNSGLFSYQYRLEQLLEKAKSYLRGNGYKAPCFLLNA